ncbi:MAG TPA: RNA polymerase sigma factor [Polyangia bacterium]
MPATTTALTLALDPAVTDEAVVARVRAGETALFEVLMRRHNQRVYRAVRAILRDDAEIEEVMQQAHVAAYQHLDQFAGKARYSTWLIRIAINEALGRRRRGLRLVPLEDGAEDEMGTYRGRPPTPEDRAGTRELAAVLEAAIDGLPEKYRLTVMLRDVEGLDTADAAAALEVSEDVVKTRLHRAREMLRAHIEAQLGSAALAAYLFGSWRCDRIVAAVLARITAEATGG